MPTTDEVETPVPEEGTQPNPTDSSGLPVEVCWDYDHMPEKKTQANRLSNEFIYPELGEMWWDGDQRRPILLILPWSEDDSDGDRYFDCDAIIARHLPNMTGDIFGVQKGRDGTEILLDWPHHQAGPRCNYPPIEEFRLPGNPGSVLRSELVERRRLYSDVDLVSYTSDDESRVVFKYKRGYLSISELWNEIHMLSLLPRHSNLLPIDKLVLDEVTGKGVIGFTAPFVDGVDWKADGNRHFKIKWMRQFLQVLDDLNLKFGILHWDLKDENFIIDKETDTLILIDFGRARTLELEREAEEEDLSSWREDDVRDAVIVMHGIVTNTYKRRPDPMETYLDRANWVKHPDMRLDTSVDQFFDELMAWYSSRVDPATGRPTDRSVTRPSDPISYPELKRRGVRQRDEGPGPDGLPYIDWRRPSERDVDPSRRLLATGKYADEEPEENTDFRGGRWMGDTLMLGGHQWMGSSLARVTSNGLLPHHHQRRAPMTDRTRVTPPSTSEFRCAALGANPFVKLARLQTQAEKGARLVVA